MSTHAVNTVIVEAVLKHPAADQLEIIPIKGTPFQAVVKMGQFNPGDTAIYIEPDYVVPTDREEFAFLASRAKNNKYRLKAVRLRGVVSHGLLIPVPSTAADHTGLDWMSVLGITRYEPPMNKRWQTSAQSPHVALSPNILMSKFDLEALHRYADVLEDDEEVVVTEKIHGSNARYVWQNETFHAGSRGLWWKAGAPTPYTQQVDLAQVEAFCKENPEVVLYGEVYGPVQNLHYGSPKDVQFSAFAAYESRQGVWWPYERLFVTCSLFDIRVVPLLYKSTWKEARAELPALLEKDSWVQGAPDGHICEGAVITPVIERIDPRIGRVSLKVISNRYWEHKDA